MRLPRLIAPVCGEFSPRKDLEHGPSIRPANGTGPFAQSGRPGSWRGIKGRWLNRHLLAATPFIMGYMATTTETTYNGSYSQPDHTVYVDVYNSPRPETIIIEDAPPRNPCANVVAGVILLILFIVLASCGGLQRSSGYRTSRTTRVYYWRA